MEPILKTIFHALSLFLCKDFGVYFLFYVAPPLSPSSALFLLAAAYMNGLKMFPLFTYYNVFYLFMKISPIYLLQCLLLSLKIPPIYLLQYLLLTYNNTSYLPITMPLIYLLQCLLFTCNNASYLFTTMPTITFKHA